MRKLGKEYLRSPHSKNASLTSPSIRSIIKETGDWYYSDPERLRRARQNLPAARREVVSISLSSLGIDDLELARKLADSYGAEKEKAIFVYPGAIETIRHFKNHREVWINSIF